MDKYEYKLKLDQIKALAAEKDYQTAAELADSINWRKVKNANLLVTAGDVYFKTGRYDEAKEIFLNAYDRSPIGKMIVYRLTELSIKMQNFDEAEEYYEEFVDIAPHDYQKYILRYKISKAKGEDYQAQIKILEELKEVEYTEEWAYELAYLYHQSEQAAKCIEACDELILWFGEGIYVERALELKMLYQPLTKPQEEKYRSFKRKKENIKEDSPQEGATQITIPAVEENMDRYNTLNLQEELAKNMRQIMDATETETVEDTMNNIKRITEEIPYLQISYEAKTEETDKGAEEEKDDSLKINIKEILSEENNKTNSLPEPELPKELSTEENTSIEDVLNEWEHTKRVVESAIEKVKQQELEIAKTKALQEANEIMERLLNVTPKLDAGMKPFDLLKEKYLGELGAAVADAGLVDVIKEESLSETEKAGRFVAGMNQILQREIDRLQAEDLREKQKEESSGDALLNKIKEAKPNFDEQIGLRPYVPNQFDQEAAVAGENISSQGETAEGSRLSLSSNVNPPGELFAGRNADELEEAYGGQNVNGLEEAYEDQNVNDLEEAYEDQNVNDLEEAYEDQNVNTLGESPANVLEKLSEKYDDKEEIQKKKLRQQDEVAIAAKQMIEEEIMTEEGDTAQLPPLPSASPELPRISLPEDITEDIVKQNTKDIKPAEISRALDDQLKKIANNEEEAEAGKRPAIFKLSEEQKNLFSYFVPVAGMEQQICQVLTGASARLSNSANSATGNILIQGGSGCGKTVLATALIKALQREIKRPRGKIGKLDAAALNKKDIHDLLKKVSGGCLIIEKAGEMNRETAVKLSLLLENETSGLLVIMEDTRVGLNRVLELDDSLAKKFTEKIVIPVFTSDELVEFGKAYANDLDYDIDEMGVLALYNRISNIQRLDRATTLTEVKEIIDGAIERVEKNSLKKAISIITSKRYNKNDYVILREKDFEE